MQTEGVDKGLPFSAADYATSRLTPNDVCHWSNYPGQYLMRSATSSWRAGIKKDALLIIDSARKPCDGSIVVAEVCGEFLLKRMRFHPILCLADLDQPDDVTLIDGGDWEGEETIIFGVVPHVINDMTTEEFDDSLLMGSYILQRGLIGWMGG
ncbi:DNA polymerase V [Ewingella americana]|nr:DNA polymerase V [Ewingella americana]